MASQVIVTVGVRKYRTAYEVGPMAFDFTGRKLELRKVIWLSHCSAIDTQNFLLSSLPIPLVDAIAVR